MESKGWILAGNLATLTDIATMAIFQSHDDEQIRKLNVKFIHNGHVCGASNYTDIGHIFVYQANLLQQTDSGYVYSTTSEHEGNQLRATNYQP